MAATANRPRPITSDFVYDLPTVASPAISPDGSRVAYASARIDRETMESESHIAVVPFGGGPARRLTAGPRDRRPHWSPDGASIAFLRSASGEDGTAPPPQSWLLPLDGGEARQLNDSPGGRLLDDLDARRRRADLCGRGGPGRARRGRRPERAASQAREPHLLPRRRAGMAWRHATASSSASTPRAARRSNSRAAITTPTYRSYPPTVPRSPSGRRTARRPASAASPAVSSSASSRSRAAAWSASCAMPPARDRSRGRRTGGGSRTSREGRETASHSPTSTSWSASEARRRASPTTR